MPGLVEGNGATYISSHSADVILSDIRPFKLKTDALLSINVLLDELLYTILNTSGSLVTDRLRAGLLTLLPTSLGKEALLEAEVELRAYWERTATTGTVPSLEDDSSTFHPQWSFELLRNKCEAYSTLNEADEDPAAEGRINERFGRSGSPPPKAALLAPAALYLTAILEAVCEHVLSNVGRVAARDSSRTTATVNDLFTALCEDASIYPYFRTMKVYDQIEQLSQTPKPSRRSKSFTRNDKGSISRTMTPQQDLGSSQTATTGSLSRQSSEGSSVANGHNHHNPPRSSFDKSRALRMFANGKSSHEREESQSAHGHKKSVSLSENAKRPSNDADGDFVEDSAMLQEFDDLMRSASTMKMSLTPDRLKTMEVYKQEKDQRGQRRPTPLTTRQEAEAPSSRPPPPPLPSARQVEAIIEDDEEGSSPKMSNSNRMHQGSFNTQPPNASMSAQNRARSVSTSGAVARKTGRQPPTVPSSFPAHLHGSASNPNMALSRSLQAGPTPGANGGPARKRTRQKNPEDMDLDDIMNGSDEDEPEPTSPPARGPGAQKRTAKVSSTTRELMDFLAEGPPGDGPDLEIHDFMANGPSKHLGSSTASLEKPKANRLQRMISKLNIGNEKPKGGNESPVKSPGHYRTVTGAQHPTHPGAFSPLANRPIPPRPPRPPQPPQSISPPSSPSQHSLVDENHAKPPAPPIQRVPSIPDQYRVANAQPHNGVPPSPSRSPNMPHHMPKSIMKEIPNSRSIPHTNGNGNGHAHAKPVYQKPPSPPQPQPESSVSPSPQSRTLARKPVPTDDLASERPRPVQTQTPPPAPSPQPQAQSQQSVLSEADLLDMQRLFANATTADECRLIFDMFMTRNKIAGNGPKAPEPKAPYPSPSPSLIRQSPQVRANTLGDGNLENTVVELLLGGSSGSASPARSSSPAVSQPPPAQHQAQVQPPSPPKARKLPRVPAPDPNAYVPNGTPVQRQESLDQEKPANLATWKNPSEFPTHATLIPA